MGVSRRSQRTIFVGREHELGALGGALAAARAGRGDLVLLTGEAGVGKTRLAERIAGDARDGGMRVARGPCWDGGGAPAYWPWIQVLRALAGDAPAAPAALSLGRGAAELAALVPELRLGPGAAPDETVEPRAADSDRRRFELFDAIRAYLATAGGDGLVIVLDDLHAADESSLLLLSFLARQLHDVALLIIGTQRDGTPPASARIASLLESLARDGRRLRLAGLGHDDVAAIVEARTGVTADAALLTAIQRVTAGNPFFVDEIARELARAGRLAASATARGELPLPDSVRVALQRRLAPLPADGRRLLDAAAVIGREFRLTMLAAACERTAGETLTLLEPALQLGLVRQLPDPPRRYEFVHALIRESIVRGLNAGARMGWHRRVGELLERHDTGSVHGHLAALAFHWTEAIPIAGARRAVDYAQQAGEHAVARQAYAEAAQLFAQALAALDDDGCATLRRCELQLALGSAQRRAGDVARARATFEDAGRAARELRAELLQARAALGYAGVLGGPGISARSDERVIALLEQALAALSPEPSAERGQLLARLALELYYTPYVARRTALSQAAVETAAAIGDTRTRMIALYARSWSTLGPDQAEQRRLAADELLALAHRCDDPEMRFSAHHFRVVDSLERGDLAAVDDELAACGHLAGALGQPLYRWQYGLLRAMRALMAGRAADSERFALQAFEDGRVVDEETAANLLAAQLFKHRWIVGRLDELAGAVDDFAAKRPWIPAWRCAAAFLRAETGDRAGARAALDAIGVRGYARLPRDGNWSVAIWTASYAASAIGARDHAAALWELAAPVAERVAVMAAGDASLGSMALPAAALATTLEHWDEAGYLLDAADRVNARLDARALVALAHRERARMLVARGRRADHERAAAACAAALALADELGMMRLRTQAQELLEELPVDVRPPGAAPGAGREAVLERSGDLWRVGCEPAVTLVKDTKGMSHLATLLAAPGVAFAALDLVEASAAGHREPRAGGGAADAERARLNVTRAVRSAIARIAAHDDALGEELDAAVHTGAVARYEPAGPGATSWRVSP